MADTQVFYVRPIIRCFGKSNTPTPTICGEPATWERPGAAGHPPEFYCDDCRHPDDQPLRGDSPFRRVGIFVEVLFAAASNDTAIAHTEVANRLDQAVREIGGVLDIRGVASAIGRVPRQEERLELAGRGVGGQ